MSGNATQRYGLAVLSHLLLVAAWQAFVVLGHVPKFVMPSPYATVEALLVLEQRGFKAAVMDAAIAAYRKSKSLGDDSHK